MHQSISDIHNVPVKRKENRHITERSDIQSRENQYYGIFKQKI